MNFQYISDLHLEFPENREFLKKNPIIPKADILILAGDIIPDKYKKKAKYFYELWEAQFEYVLSIPGNHEYYYGEIQYAYPKYFKKITKSHYKINNQSIIIGNTKFICTSLWTHIPEIYKFEIENNVNDYKLIKFNSKELFTRNISIEDVNIFHKLSLNFLESELSIPFGGDIVVITHHLPSFELIQKDDRNEYINHYCASDLDELIKKYNPKYWIFGHYHKTIKIKLYNTIFLSNPLGYMDEIQKNYFSFSEISEI